VEDLAIDEPRDLLITMRQFLKDTPKEDWETIKYTYLDREELEPDHFHDAMRQFKLEYGYAHRNDRAKMLHYLEFVTKPYHWTMAQFISRVRVLYRYAAMMPADVDKDGIDSRLRPTDMQLKQLVYRASTVESKAAFVAANQRLQDLTLHVTVAYFDDLRSSQSMVAAASRSPGRNGNNNKQSNDNHDNNRDSKRHRG
jgi:hypothetical protein